MLWVKFGGLDFLLKLKSF